MSDFQSTHQWKNGAVVTAKKVGDKINLRVEDDYEQMLCDVFFGEYEALCVAHSLLSVITKKDT